MITIKINILNFLYCCFLRFTCFLLFTMSFVKIDVVFVPFIPLDQIISKNDKRYWNENGDMYSIIDGDNRIGWMIEKRKSVDYVFINSQRNPHIPNGDLQKMVIVPRNYQWDLLMKNEFYRSFMKHLTSFCSETWDNLWDIEFPNVFHFNYFTCDIRHIHVELFVELLFYIITQQDEDVYFYMPFFLNMGILRVGNEDEYFRDIFLKNRTMRNSLGFRRSNKIKSFCHKFYDQIDNALEEKENYYGLRLTPTSHPYRLSEGVLRLLLSYSYFYENVERIRATFGFQDSNIVYDKYNYMEEVFEQMFMEFRDYINELCNPLVQNVSHSTFIPRTNNNHSFRRNY